jgi:hypothetical protein
MGPARPRPEDVDLATALQVVARHVLAIHPYSQGIRVVSHHPDGDAVIPVPFESCGDSIEDQVSEMLGKFKPGVWVGAKAIAAELDKDANNGAFKRTLARMAKEHKVESNRNLGYRLPVSG